VPGGCSQAGVERDARRTFPRAIGTSQAVRQKNSASWGAESRTLQDVAKTVASGASPVTAYA
jgi:hypothetical protein